MSVSAHVHGRHCSLQSVWGGPSEARYGMYIGLSERSDVLQLFAEIFELNLNSVQA